MEKEAFLLFPTVILKYEYKRQFTEKEIAVVANQMELNNGGNTTSDSKRILEHPDMIDLKNYAQACLDDYFIQMYNPARPEEVRLKITQSWLNYSKPGQFHHTHMHPNSIVSGCLYIEADPNLDVIEFKQFQPKSFFIEPKEINYYNTIEFTVRVGKGDCVLFPSMTHHSVPEVKSEKTRISLAFNSFFEGKIGLADDGVNYLEINNIK